MLIRAFLASDTAPFERRFLRILKEAPVHLAGQGRRRGFWEQLPQTSADLVIASAGALPEPLAASVKALRELPERPEVILVSPREDGAERAALLGAGAAAVLYAGLPDASLRDALLAIISRRAELARGDRREERARVSLDDFVSTSAEMTKLVETARRVADADSALLILGETGVGKEQLAKGIHARSRRAAGPFVAVNCAAIPDALLESELFGHAMGAFTGAHRARRGYFELAHGGTLFLDEVGDMSPITQAKLLRALQEHRIQPLGSESSIDVDVRIVGATNRDLRAEISAQRFRKDLYYRLGVVTLEVPPLRRRRDDIPALVGYYRAHFAHLLRRGVTGVDPDAMRALVGYDWPGNVRELINVIEHAVLLCAGDAIRPVDLPLVPSAAPASASGPGADDALHIGTGAWKQQVWADVRAVLLREGERRYLELVLGETSGRIGEAARRAGMTPRSLARKMRDLGLRKETFRRPPPLA